ncbi:internal head protein [Pseudomonas phage PhiPA3]|uniref:Virion structural protein n=1 Tax=Pseudomonas phage PhiPA3 TaxID=998086 RepID=F8SK57_BPPA3|nr:internal head protein [Pseudomonas phage PhiPA3]AEH03610.1 virion structural protein [Pseudomonas phage PhiPA3]
MTTIAAWDEVCSDWDKITKIQSSLERFADVLAGRDEATEEMAQVISIGLESIDPNFDIKEGSKITLRAIKEGIVMAAKAARDLIRYLWELLNSFYVKFTGSIRRVRRTQEGISRRLGKLGSKTTYQKMSVSGIQRLSIDGNFVGTELSNLQDIHQLTNYILNQYPKSVVKIARDASRQFLNILDQGGERQVVMENAVDAFADILQRDFIPPQGFRPVQPRELGSLEKGVNRSEILPGNVAFLYTPPDVIRQQLKSGKGNLENIIKSSFTMQFSELQLNVADRSEREIEVPSVRTLSEITEKISSILSLAERAEAGRKDFATVKVVVDDAIRQIAERSSEENNSGNVLLHITGEISKKLAEPMGFYTHWLAVTLNVWLNFVSQCIKHYEDEGV